MGNTSTTIVAETFEGFDGGDTTIEPSSVIRNSDQPGYQDSKRNEGGPHRTVRNPTLTTCVTYDDAASMSTCNTSFTTKSQVKALHQVEDGQYSNRTNKERGQLLQKIKRQQAQTRHIQANRENLQSHPLSPYNNNKEIVDMMLYASPSEDEHFVDSHLLQQDSTRPYRARTTSVKCDEEQWKENWDNDSGESSDEEDEDAMILPSRNTKPGVPKLSKFDLTRQADDALKFGKGDGAVAWETTSDSSQNGGEVLDKPDLNIFSQLRVLGKGSFGKVVLVQKSAGCEKGRLFAMKTLRKTHLLKRGQIERTRTERKVLSIVDHPFIMKLHFAFQTVDKLYLVLDYCAGGELFFHLSRHRRFPEKYTRFYSAELLLALRYLHSKGIVYRDLKPENVLFDAEGHVKLGDFGLAKANIEHFYKGTRSRVGTPEYMSPEVLQKWGHGFCVDYWGLGMLTYEMMTGLPPWYTTNRQELLKRLTKAPLQIPSHFSPQARTFVASLLERDPKNRLGVHGSESAISHDFFGKLDFNAIEERQIEAPILPCEGWKVPQPERIKQKGIIRGFFSGVSARQTAGFQHYQSDDLDAATANFDKQFTRMALDSQTSNDCEDEYSDDNCGSQELNEDTFIGFTFDEPSPVEGGFDAPVNI